MNIARELVVVAKEVVAGNMEYAIWGIPKGGSSDTLLIAMPDGKPITNRAEALRFVKLLQDKYGARKVRVQEIDMSGELDWMKEIKMAKEVVAWEGRMNFPRSFYIPKNAPGLKQLDEGKDVGLEFWSYEDGRGGVYGLAFGGKANKPLWHYRFRNQEKFEEQVRLTISDRKSHAERIEKQKQERTQFKHTLKEGDIMYSSWGYDQTNIDFYQVVAVGEKSVKIRKIGQKTVGSATTSEEVVADPNHFVGPPMTKVVRPGDVVSIASYASAYKWDGKPKYQTAFGFGH